MRRQRRAHDGPAPWWCRLWWLVVEAIDAHGGWSKRGRLVGAFTLTGLRDRLRHQNLFDPSGGVSPAALPKPSLRPFDLAQRQEDGSWNDVSHPARGMESVPLGRNIPLTDVVRSSGTVGTPDPRLISLELMTRPERGMVPAPGVNVLGAAWIQFMVRDWFSHGPAQDQEWLLPPTPSDRGPDDLRRIPKAPRPLTPAEGLQAPAPARANTLTHWWDGSQLYPSTPGAPVSPVRVDGSGALLPDGHVRLDLYEVVPEPLQPAVPPADAPGFWLGLAMLMELFAKEHNAICDMLHAHYPDWQGDELFRRARLINAALMAKIHTIDWVSAILAHPTTQQGTRVEWYGVLGERVHHLLGRIGRGEILSGIPGSARQNFHVPFSITEEFVAVYRMHPLIPDDYQLRSLDGSQGGLDRTLREISGRDALAVRGDWDLGDLLYSFGTAHAGAVVLHNYPRDLQRMSLAGGRVQDLAATDILRCREYGVPRYNQFRRLLRLPPAQDFDFFDYPPGSGVGQDIRKVYDGRLEDVDLLVGMYAEPRPDGFAISETAFRIFLVMAARRLNSDRFYTDDFNADTYTREGLAWIDHNTFQTVLLRHFPRLGPVVRARPNAFLPW